MRTNRSNTEMSRRMMDSYSMQMQMQKRMALFCAPHSYRI